MSTWILSTAVYTGFLGETPRTCISCYMSMVCVIAHSVSFWTLDTDTGRAYLPKLLYDRAGPGRHQIQHNKSVMLGTLLVSRFRQPLSGIAVLVSQPLGLV